MNQNEVKNIKNVFLVNSLNILIIGFILFFLSHLLLKLASLVFIFIGLVSLLVYFEKDHLIRIKHSIKKFIVMNIMYPLGMLVSKMLSLNLEMTMQFYILINNRINPNIKTVQVMLLLPRCIQNSTCSKDLASDINNCIRCGNCQVNDILELSKDKKVVIKLVGGGKLALERIKEIAPESIIAVACERELIDGIKEVTGGPVWAVNNLRPNGPCKDTSVDINELKGILNKCLLEDIIENNEINNNEENKENKT